MMLAFDGYWVDTQSNTDMEFRAPRGAPAPRMFALQSDGFRGRDSALQVLGASLEPLDTQWALDILGARMRWMTSTGNVHPDSGMSLRDLEALFSRMSEAKYEKKVTP